MFFIDMKRVERPKRPVSRGRRGSFTGRFRAAKPRKPARRKIVNEIKKSDSRRIR